MRKINKIMLGLLTLGLGLTLVGCGRNATTNKPTTKPTTTTQVVEKDIVKVKEIKKAEPAMRMLKSAPKASIELKDSIIEENKTINYVVMYKDDETVDITIFVENPKAVKIDQIELSSTDPDAEVIVFDNGEKISQDLATQPVVRWNGSSAYQTTYTLKTTMSSEVDFAVVDFQINNEWQKAEDIGNANLHVYRIDADILTLEVLTNVKISDTEYVATFKFITKEGYEITDLVMQGNRNYTYDEETEIYTGSYGSSSNFLIDVDYEIKISENISYRLRLYSEDGIITENATE